MSERLRFAEVARDQGFGAEAAEAALAAVEARLAAAGIAPRRLFCFRTGGQGAPGEGGEAGREPPARPRTLLLFTEADEALGFAQHNGLGRSPRLTALTLGQALAALLQRPAIGSLLVARGGEPAEPPRGGLPPGVQIERADLLALLAGARP